MRKSNSKALYHLSKKIKMKQNLPPQSQDSLQINQQPRNAKTNIVLKPTHMRSQSCPFQVKNMHNSLKLKEKQQSEFNPTSISNLKKKKNHQSSSSQLSIQNKTVIIKQLPLQQISTILFRKNQNKSNKNVILKKNILSFKGEKYTKSKLNRQIKTYQLKLQLQNIQKQSQNMTIKQRIIENMLLKCQHQVEENMFQFA